MIHPTAEIESGATIGANTRIWHFAHVRAEAVLGEGCNIGHSVFIDRGCRIGSFVKLQNRVSVYRGVTLEDGVFVGPHTTFTNDLYPRAITPAGEPIHDDDWEPLPTLVRHGASVGAGCVVLPGLTIGAWAMIGARSRVAHDVPEQALVLGEPARQTGWVCPCGRPLRRQQSDWICPRCRETFDLPEIEVAAELRMLSRNPRA